MARPAQPLRINRKEAPKEKKQRRDHWSVYIGLNSMSQQRSMSQAFTWCSWAVFFRFSYTALGCRRARLFSNPSCAPYEKLPTCQQDDHSCDELPNARKARWQSYHHDLWHKSSATGTSFPCFKTTHTGCDQPTREIDSTCTRTPEMPPDARPITCVDAAGMQAAKDWTLRTQGSLCPTRVCGMNWGVACLNQARATHLSLF